MQPPGGAKDRGAYGKDSGVISFRFRSRNPRSKQNAQEKRGRISHSFEDHRPRITAPYGMSPEETALFRKIVEDCHPSHFAQCDAPLLRAYVQACLLPMRCAIGKSVAARWPRWPSSCAYRRKIGLIRKRSCGIAGQSRRELGVSLESLAAIRDGARGWAVKG